MADSNVRIPPDSTGKRISTSTTLEISYSNLTGDLVVNDVVTCSTSGLIGIITLVVPTNSTAGDIHVQLYRGIDGILVIGETFTSVGVAPIGTGTITSVGIPYHTPKSVLVGGNNIYNAQSVDAEGAASVRFAAGSPTLNAFGSLAVADPHTVGAYDFSDSKTNSLFSTESGSGGSVAHQSVTSTHTLSVSTSSGSYAESSTNKYHFYWPGRGILGMMTIANSDTGVVGNVRRWGMYDDEDGVFFELSGSLLSVVLRSSTSGTTVDTKVQQSDWNVDKLDGTELSKSKQVLNVDKVTPYFMDYQWLGAGKIRFGVLAANGVRVFCHEMENSGNNNYPYMANGSLPIRLENRNLTGIGSTPSIRLTCAVVTNEGVLDYTFWRNTYTHPQKTVSGSNIPLMSVRSKITVDGKRNRVNVYPEKYNCYVSPNSAFRLDFCWPAVLSNDTWAEDNGTSLEADFAADSASFDADSWVFYSDIIEGGKNTVDLTPVFETNDEGIITNSRGSYSPPFSIVATLISGASGSIDGTLNYKELK
jgi:hypothetical protein